MQPDSLGSIHGITTHTSQLISYFHLHGFVSVQCSGFAIMMRQEIQHTILSCILLTLMTLAHSLLSLNFSGILIFLHQSPLPFHITNT
jgi:hypothetical protein